MNKLFSYLALLASVCISYPASASFSTVSISSGAQSGGDGKRPNIILIMLDDVHRGRYKNLGSPYLWNIPNPTSALTTTHRLDFPDSTPTLDSLLANGINFSGMWANSACNNTRRALLTGGLNAGALPDDTGQISNYPLQGVAYDKTNASQQLLTPVSRIKSAHPEYKYFASGKCMLGASVSTNGAVIDRYVYRHSKGQTWSGAGQAACGMAFNNDGLGPSNFFNYSDGTTHTTVALTRADYPPASNANIWYPANGVSDGYASEPLAYSLGFQKVLQEVIYSPGGTPVSSNAADPWIIGWAANAIHGSDSIHNGGVDLNGHPLSEIINWPANSSLPDNLEMTTLGGLFGAVQVPITCPGHSQSAMSAATDFELITMANTCANRYLENLDLSLGTLLDSLAPRVLRNTYVIFTADNTSQPNSGSNYDSGFPSNYVFDTQVAMALSGNTGTAPTGVCEYTWGPNANSAVQVTANMRCGKGHAFQRFENEFSVPFVIAHGRIPKHLRGNTSHVRMRTPDITETIISMATYGEPEATIVQATDGNDITSVWGVGADPADFTSPYHQLNTGTVQIGTVDASITSTDCRGDIAVLDPNSLGEVYRLIRSECREDYIQNLTSATPFTDLRPIANPAGTAEGIRVFAAWESLIDLIDARQLAGLGLNSGGQTPTNAGPNTGEGPIVP